MKKWLPPIEVCCDNAVIEIFIHSNNTVHFSCDCEEHGRSSLKSPLKQSHFEYVVINNFKGEK